MKKYLIALISAMFFAPAVALADVCEEYAKLLIALTIEEQEVIAMLTDPAKIESTKLEYESRREVIRKKMDANGCNTTDSTVLPPPPAPEPDPTPIPNPGPDPVTNPNPVNPDPVTPDPDPVTPDPDPAIDPDKDQGKNRGQNPADKPVKKPGPDPETDPVVVPVPNPVHPPEDINKQACLMIKAEVKAEVEKIRANGLATKKNNGLINAEINRYLASRGSDIKSACSGRDFGHMHKKNMR